MTIRSVVAKSLLSCFLVAAIGSATPAFAQHVVTDDEAGKLTLGALTAAPRVFVHRAAYRPLRMSWSDGWSRRGHSRSVGAVHEASFHRGFLHEAAFRRSVAVSGTTVHLRAGSHRRRG